MKIFFTNRLISKIKSCIVLVLISALSACGQNDQSSDNLEGLSGVVSVDGSSTVFPISEAVAEEFLSVQPRVRVTVGVSGTGGGFYKFLSGEIDITGVSRVIKDSEVEEARSSKIDFLQIPIAYDGLSVVVNKANNWVDYLTVDDLKKIWTPGSAVKSWRDIRPQWPDEPLHLYGPGTDSGTFDYFTEIINGESGSSRSDYTFSEDDNILVQGVSGDINALGFFGHAYFIANESVLKLVPIDSGKGPVRPSRDTIYDGTYEPLSRPMFIYVSKQSLERQEVRAFVEFYLDQASMLAQEVGYVEMPESGYQKSKEALASF